MNSGLLRYIVSTVFFPIYMWIIFSLLQNRLPRIFCRLGFGALLYILGVLSIVAIDFVGHFQSRGNKTHSLCMLNFTVNETSGDFIIPSINMHWSVYIPTNVLIGIGPTLVTVTIFEFISAQSPHSMKGLLLGTYYAIVGIYQFISSILLLPFSSQKFWIISSSTGCLFGYLLFTTVIGVIGFILFLMAARWYKYRERDDRPYDQRFVEDVYDRYLNPSNDHSLTSSVSD